MLKQEPISAAVMEVAASIENDIPSRITGKNRVFIRAVIARAITAAVAAEREACAVVADDVAAGRSRQNMQATTANKRTEARDFESMAMSAIDVSYKIRARSTQC